MVASRRASASPSISFTDAELRAIKRGLEIAIAEWDEAIDDAHNDGKEAIASAHYRGKMTAVSALNKINRVKGLPRG